MRLGKIKPRYVLKADLQDLLWVYKNGKIKQD